MEHHLAKNETEYPGLSPADLAICQPRTLCRAQVAQMLGVSDATFTKHQPDLEAKGFPQKLPGLNRWPRAAVETWIDCGGLVDTGEGAQPDDADEEADELLQRYSAPRLVADNG